MIKAFKVVQDFDSLSSAEKTHLSRSYLPIIVRLHNCLYPILGPEVRAGRALAVAGFSVPPIRKG